MTQLTIDPAWQNPDGSFIESRTHGYRLATWCKRLLDAFTTSNAGPNPPSFYEVGTIWFDSDAGLPKICTALATGTTEALWLTLGTSATSTPPQYISGQYAVIDTSGNTFPLNVNLSTTNNWHGKIVRITEANAEIHITQDMAPESYFFLTNNSNTSIDILFLSSLGLVSPDSQAGTRTIEGTDYDCIRIRNRQTYIIKRTLLGSGDTATKIFAQLWVYAPRNASSASPTIQPFYAFEVPASGAIPLGTIPVAGLQTRDDDSIIDASGEHTITTTPITVSGNKLIFVVPREIHSLRNNVLNHDELNSYIERQTVALELQGVVGTLEYFTYLSPPLRDGVSFTYLINFGE